MTRYCTSWVVTIFVWFFCIYFVMWACFSFFFSIFWNDGAKHRLLHLLVLMIYLSISDGILHCIQFDFVCIIFIYCENIYSKYNTLDQIILTHIFILNKMDYVHIISVNQKISLQHDLNIIEYKITIKQIFNNVKYYILMHLHK